MRRALVFAPLLLATSARALSITGAGVATKAKLLPFENKDAFFSSPASGHFGVFDGVSQCPQSRAYAQELARTACTTLNMGASGGNFTDVAREVLFKAGTAAKDYSGASTVCMVRADLEKASPQVCVYTIGDCECMVLRQPTPASIELVGVSPVNFHSNGAPYQLGGKGWVSDNPGDGLETIFDVQKGDTVLVYSDGVCNNLENEQIAQLVAQNANQDESAMASAIVDAARAAGFVDDDCTVVAVRLGEGPAARGAPEFAEVFPWEKIELPKFKLPGF